MGRSTPTKRRGINSLQVCLDHCREVSHLLQALSACPLIPGPELSELLTRGWALVRTLCEIVDVDANDLVGLDVLQHPPLSLDQVRLPALFEAALAARVGQESPASRGTVESKARWGLILTRIVIAQACYMHFVGLLARHSIAGGKPGAQPPFSMPVFNHDRHEEAVAKNGASTSEIGALLTRSVRQVAARAPLFPNTHPVDEATTAEPIAKRQAPGPAQAAVTAKETGAPTAGEARDALDSDITYAPGPDLGPAEPALPSSASIPLSAPMLNGSAAQIAIEPSPEVMHSAEPAIPAILKLELSGKVETVGQHATYGDVGGSRPHDVTLSADTSAILEAYVAKASLMGRDDFMLSPAERGYAAKPLTLRGLRELTHEILGPIELDSDAAAETAAPTFVPQRVTRIDTGEIFAKLFSVDVSGEVNDYYTNSESRVPEAAVLQFLQKNKTGRMSIYRGQEPKEFDSARIAILLGPRARSGVVELSPVIRRVARLMANKGKNKNWYRPHFHGGKHASITLDANALSFFGPAGSGKSTTIKYLTSLAEEMSKDVDIKGYDSSGVKIKPYIIDASRQSLKTELTRILAYRTSRNLDPICLIIDECTFIKTEHLELLDAVDQVIFFGDPRQLGNADGGPLVRLFVKTATGSNKALGKVYRKINPDIFRTLNFAAYDGHFEQYNPAPVPCAPFHVSTCRDDPLARATTLLLTAAHHAAEQRQTVVATQDSNILDLIEKVIELDPGRYRGLLDGVSFIPLSNLQGKETDVLVLDCAEVDNYAVDLGAALQFLFVVLGRVRMSISLVRPRREARDAEVPPMFSYLMDAVLAEGVA